MLSWHANRHAIVYLKSCDKTKIDIMSKKTIVKKSYKYHKILIINDIYNYFKPF
ncbi:MAG: hypothetical protein JWP37_1768 [Mucilaginibacter sp.]|nr:hypothetical protein [Mucilaginibacter sp.]